MHAALSLKVKYRENVTVAVGDEVLLPCNASSHSPAPVWQYRKDKTAGSVPFYETRNFSRFKRVNDSDNMTYTLILPNAQLNDSGWYECVEDGGKGPRHVTVINVTG